jgi:hypothetical protein
MLTMSMYEAEDGNSNEFLGLALGGIAGDLDGLACRSGEVAGERGELRIAETCVGSDLVRVMGGAARLFAAECGRKWPRPYGE